MPRKRTGDKELSDGFNKAFPKVLRKLMHERNVTQKMLADHLGKKNRQTVSYYCDGTSSPDWETLVNIADYFNISVDYLLGRTEEPKRMPCAADQLGLSSTAISNIQRFCTEPLEPQMVNDIAIGMNALLEQKGIFQIANAIYELQSEICSILDTMPKVLEKYNLTEADDPEALKKVVFKVHNQAKAEALKKLILDTYGEKIDTNFEVLYGTDIIESKKRMIMSRFEYVLDLVTGYKKYFDDVVNTSNYPTFHCGDYEFLIPTRGGQNNGQH